MHIGPISMIQPKTIFIAVHHLNLILDLIFREIVWNIVIYESYLYCPKVKRNKNHIHCLDHTQCVGEVDSTEICTFHVDHLFMSSQYIPAISSTKSKVFNRNWKDPSHPLNNTHGTPFVIFFHIWTRNIDSLWNKP